MQSGQSRDWASLHDAEICRKKFYQLRRYFEEMVKTKNKHAWVFFEEVEAMLLAVDSPTPVAQSSPWPSEIDSDDDEQAPQGDDAEEASQGDDAEEAPQVGEKKITGLLQQMQSTVSQVTGRWQNQREMMQNQILQLKQEIQSKDKEIMTRDNFISRYIIGATPPLGPLLQPASTIPLDLISANGPPLGAGVQGLLGAGPSTQLASIPLAPAGGGIDLDGERGGGDQGLGAGPSNLQAAFIDWSTEIERWLNGL